MNDVCHKRCAWRPSLWMKSRRRMWSFLYYRSVKQRLCASFLLRHWLLSFYWHTYTHIKDSCQVWLFSASWFICFLGVLLSPSLSFPVCPLQQWCWITRWETEKTKHLLCRSTQTDCGRNSYGTRLIIHILKWRIFNLFHTIEWNFYQWKISTTIWASNRFGDALVRLHEMTSRHMCTHKQVL